MSTNYYWHEEPCGSCGRADELHIGKESRQGWSFQGHFTADEQPRLISWADWKEHLLTAGGRIEDECERPVTVEEMIETIESTSGSGRRQQYDWLNVRRSEYGRYLDKVKPGCDWLDADGFSFHGGGFC